jgi:SAM-dependent methyltransferase
LVNSAYTLNQLRYTVSESYTSNSLQQPECDPRILDAQLSHWNTTFANNPNMYGDSVSIPANHAISVFHSAAVTNVLELGAGQGRDSLHFARSGFRVHALDYSQIGVDSITQHAEQAGLSGLITVQRHDARIPLPLAANSVDACYSHMLFNMALTTTQLEALAWEIGRVLKPGGYHIYTARNIYDAHYKSGIHRGDDMYEEGGFIVHFFSRDLVHHLAQGFDIISISEFEEGTLPRKLFLVTERVTPVSAQG